MDTLSSLVDSSLVKVEPSEEEPQFSLLETIRGYALEHLRDSADWRDVHDRHAAYFVALAKPPGTELHGTGQLAWLNQLEIRRDNLGTALSWLVEQGQPEPALDLIWATWRFWWLHGHVEELVRYVDQIVTHSDGMPSHQRALALSGAGFVRFVSGDQGQALRGWLHAYVPRAPHGPGRLHCAPAPPTRPTSAPRPAAAPSPFPALSGTHSNRRGSYEHHHRDPPAPGARTAAPDPDQPPAAADG